MLQRLLSLMAFAALLTACQPQSPDSQSEEDLTEEDSTPQMSKEDSLLKFYEKEDREAGSEPPLSLVNFVEQSLPGWKMIPLEKWDARWIEQYGTDTSSVANARADFDCDGMDEYAVLLESKNPEEMLEGVALYIFNRVEGSYEAELIGKYARSDAPGAKMGAGVVLEPAGELYFLENEEYPELESPITIDCPAITLIYFEKSANTFYYTEGKYRKVWTGD